MFRSLMVLCFLAQLAMPSWASFITFDFRGPDPNNPPPNGVVNPLGLPLGLLMPTEVVTMDGLTATITGFKHLTTPAALHRLQCCGLGVAANPNGDSTGINEVIEATFAKHVVALEALILEGGPDDGSIDLFVDGMLKQTIKWISGAGTFEVQDLNGLKGKEFRFVTTNRGWRLATLTVKVPEPGTYALFGLGLAALLSRRQRRYLLGVSKR